MTLGENYCTVGNFWIKAPVNGQYRLSVAGDDSWEVFLNPTPNTPTVDYATQKVAYSSSHTSWRNYFARPTEK